MCSNQIRDITRKDVKISLKFSHAFFKESLEAVGECLKKLLPGLSDNRMEEIRYAQKTIEELTYNFLKQVIQ